LSKMTTNIMLERVRAEEEKGRAEPWLAPNGLVAGFS
jgi:hypothetical protein